jgi:branched-chain amino acid transport system ATP-binding protein
MLEFRHVSARYGQIEALSEVSLTVQEGEIVTLIGANGAGKTTLLMSLCGNPRPSQGQILFRNQPITHLETADIMRLGIAIVPEGRRIFSGLTVEENLHLGAFFMTREQREEDLDSVFRLFPRLKERLHQRGGTMSGGEQQMLAIARALMSRPKLLLLDEPSLGLAPLVIRQIFETLAQLRERGMTLFLVEQNANQALKLADRGYVLENGRILLQDSAAALLVNDAVRQAYLGV